MKKTISNYGIFEVVSKKDSLSGLSFPMKFFWTYKKNFAKFVEIYNTVIEARKEIISKYNVEDGQQLPDEAIVEINELFMQENTIELEEYSNIDDLNDINLTVEQFDVISAVMFE